ncbi:MAG: FAD-binding oxidoreductase [Micromonosporaceae bacterium]|nr:FAD-binding oxidoreductase [Micromonosporaceae bacterium]
MELAEAVVVGGGVVGASILYHLAAAGCPGVLIERGSLAGGSTSASAGGFRGQFSDELNIRIAVESIGRFARFAAEFDTEIDFRQNGYLFLLREAEVPAFRAEVALQNSLGVPSRLIDLDEALRIVPGVSPAGLAAATWCPIDGQVTPEAVVQGYVKAARRLGARTVTGKAAHEILVQHGRVTGVRTDRGTIGASLVFCAAGVWSPELLATAGVAMPVTPQRRYVYQVAGRGPLPPRPPLTADFATGLYFHGEGTGLLIGGAWPSVEEIAPVALARLPFLADLGISGGWSGLYEMSPDHNAVVGGCAQPAGLFYATGFSGHGFQQAPVVGEYLADLALGRTPPLDLSAFSVDRFTGAEATPRPEANVV